MAEILHQLRLVVYPIIHRVSAPSQVVVWDFSHQQYLWRIVFRKSIGDNFLQPWFSKMCCSKLGRSSLPSRHRHWSLTLPNESETPTNWVSKFEFPNPPSFFWQIFRSKSGPFPISPRKKKRTKMRFFLQNFPMCCYFLEVEQLKGACKSTKYPKNPEKIGVIVRTYIYTPASYRFKPLYSRLQWFLG